MAILAPRYDFIYLASQSPRRRELLGQIGVRFEMLLADDDEDAEALEALIDGESAHDYVSRVTHAKAGAALARRVRRGLPAAPILSADTTVTIDGQILGKPADAAEARQMLLALSGRSHQVLTAVAVDCPGTIDTSGFAISVSDVLFAPLDPEQIERYIASGEPFGKAGAYGIQGRAAAFVASLTGSYSGVMGLPLFEAAALLRETGLSF
jgi:septum formation protein